VALPDGTPLKASFVVKNWSLSDGINTANGSGGMVSSNTEGGIEVTYDDPTGKLNFSVTPALITEFVESAQDASASLLNHSDHNKITATYNDETNNFDDVLEWVLDTDGTNLIELLANPNIDSTRTISNDIREIYDTLGIEAARNALYKELVAVTNEGSMNYRHMSLLIDTMTYKGQLMSIDRHGINRGDIGPLAKSSFEETTDMLINASIFAEYDKVNGVSANVMLGQQPPCGTGDSKILIDEEYMIELLNDINIKNPMNEGMLDSIAESVDENEEEKFTYNENDLQVKLNLDKKNSKCYKLPQQNINII
jgi:DNA-directed RNA polymerase beta' subunit